MIRLNELQTMSYTVIAAWFYEVDYRQLLIGFGMVVLVAMSAPRYLKWRDGKLAREIKAEMDEAKK